MCNEDTYGTNMCPVGCNCDGTCCCAQVSYNANITHEDFIIYELPKEKQLCFFDRDYYYYVEEKLPIIKSDIKRDEIPLGFS